MPRVKGSFDRFMFDERDDDDDDDDDDGLGELEDAIANGAIETEDGCIVELDGECPHGCKSPLLEMGLI
jgi:hypothetical protein